MPSITEHDRTFHPDRATVPPAGEVEVARVVYPETTGSDVVSIRARREGRRIAYRVVTDNGDVLRSRQPSAHTLTTAQLIRLIHQARQAGAYWHYLLRHCGIPRADLPAYQVCSDHYPAVRGYFANQRRRLCGMAH